MANNQPLRIAVVGGVAGGASAAARIRRLDEQAEITIFERGEHVSFSNCCLPYYLSGAVESSDSLIMMTPAGFKKRFNIDVRTSSEIRHIDCLRHELTVADTVSGTETVFPYDKLILSTGSEPVKPGIPGEDGANVFSVRNVADIVKIKEHVDNPGNETAVIFGGGPVGLEVAENLRLLGKKVSVILRGKQILSASYDYDMAQILHKELLDHGIEILRNTSLLSIEPGSVTVKTGEETKTIPADTVILAAGTVPASELAEEAGLRLCDSGAISVNHNYQTSDPDIYAVGDVIEVYNSISRKPGRIALAGPAQMAARSAADHICGLDVRCKGFIGSSCIKLFGLNAASTGLNEKSASKAGYQYDSVTVFPNDKVGIMPGSRYMALKLLFEIPTGRLLGAQAIGPGDVVGRVNVIAALLKMNAVLDDLKETELCYAPPFGTAKDPVNIAALVGLNILNGKFRQVHVSDVRSLAESGAYIVDVREEREYAAGHIVGSHNIPLSQLRSRVSEVPRDIPVYLHCRSSQRSYDAICFLQGQGYENVANISGSYLGLSLYEYFDDIQTGRKPILTAYNFS